MYGGDRNTESKSILEEKKFPAKRLILFYQKALIKFVINFLKQTKSILLNCGQFTFKAFFQFY